MSLLVFILLVGFILSSRSLSESIQHKQIGGLNVYRSGDFCGDVTRRTDTTEAEFYHLKLAFRNTTKQEQRCRISFKHKPPERVGIDCIPEPTLK
jgi:hypothetical protein